MAWRREERLTIGPCREDGDLSPAGGIEILPRTEQACEDEAPCHDCRDEPEDAPPHHPSIGDSGPDHRAEGLPDHVTSRWQPS